MGVRTNVDLTFEVGRNNKLDVLEAEGSLQSLLDTLARTESGTYSLAKGETNVQVDFGDVAEARIVYIEADREVTVTPGAPGLATKAQVDGSGGTYPTGFTGGETLNVEIDNGGVLNVSFESGDSSLAQVVNRINSVAALNGQGPVASDNGSGELRLEGLTTGVSSEVDIQGGTALATLGLSAAVTNGQNAVSGQTPLQLYRPANIGDAQLSDGVKAWALMSLRTTSLLLDNPDPDNPVEVKVIVAGDVLLEPVSC